MDKYDSFKVTCCKGGIYGLTNGKEYDVSNTHDSKYYRVVTDNGTIVLRDKDLFVTEDHFFLCSYCLEDTNVGRYHTKYGTCSKCGEENVDGNYITQCEIDKADKLGNDSVGVLWLGALPAYNVAHPGTVCPICGNDGITRTKKECMDEQSNLRYKCSDCGMPLRITNHDHEPPIQTEAELGEWVEAHKVFLKVGEQHRAYGKTLTLCSERKTLFFVDENYKVVGKMLTASTGKTRDMAASKVILTALLGGTAYECKWKCWYKGGN